MTWTSYRTLLPILVAAAGIACATTNEDERFNLLARDREFSLVVHDMDKVLGFYLPDASLFLPGLPEANGIERIRAAAQQFGAAPGFSIEWEPTRAELGASADMGFVTGIYRMTTRDTKKPITGSYVEVWKKVRGDWRIVEHVFHPNPD